MRYRDDAVDNEVWQDAEGTLYVPHPYDDEGWLAFGYPKAVYEGENPETGADVEVPMIRLFLADGTLDPAWVNPRPAWAAAHS